MCPLDNQWKEATQEYHPHEQVTRSSVKVSNIEGHLTSNKGAFNCYNLQKFKLSIKRIHPQDQMVLMELDQVMNIVHINMHDFSKHKP